MIRKRKPSSLFMPSPPLILILLLVKYADVMCPCGSFSNVQMKEFAEKLPPEVTDNENLKSLHAQAEDFINTNSGKSSLELDQQCAADKSSLIVESSRMEENRVEDQVESADPQTSSGSSSRSPESSTARTEGQREVIEQFEPGVYVTLLQLPNGAKVFQRVKFR